jgi:hypothetical protein
VALQAVEHTNSDAVFGWPSAVAPQGTQILASRS